MRHVAMQILTWGTAAGSIDSALPLAALQDPPARYAVEPLSLSPLPTEPTRAGRSRSPSTTASAAEAASSPIHRRAEGINGAALETRQDSASWEVPRLPADRSRQPTA